MPSLRLQRGVWLKKLRGIEECASIRFGGGGRKGGGAKEYSFSLSEGVVKGLERMAGGSIFLLYTALLSAVQVNVYRYSGVSAVVTGSPKRQKEGVGDEQGNLVAIATEISGDLSFRECLLQVRENLLEAYENQDYPLETLLKDLEWEKGSCFFDMVVCMHGLHQEGGSQDTPATLMWEKEGQAIRGSWRFSEEWCSQKTIAEFSRQIERVLEGGVGNHQVKVRELSWLGEGEQIEMVEGLNASGKGEAGEQTIVELFEEQVKRSPEAVALAEEGKRVRYGELNERANRIGHYLRERGVGPEVKVGLCVERGVELVCGILGVLKAGGVYVPLDPEYPAERLSYMLKDSGATMVLRPAGLMGQLEKKETGGIRDICLADANMEIESQSRENPEKNVNGENLAYVIYTSGSTGRPKGVGVTQTGLAERAHSLGKEYGLQGQDRLLQYVSPSFDAFGEELFPLLLCGGALVLQKDVKLLPSDEMLELIEREQITVLHIPPGYWGELEKHMTRTGRKISSSVRLLITGGEAVYGEQAERWIAATGTELCTAYGPTETTITATMHRRSQREEEKREEEEENCVSLGRPVAHTRVYVLDEGQQVVPVGVVGELYIAGVGVARGYLKNAEQTAEKFLPDPFQRGQRMYRSGDLARWNRSGELGFMGRKDRQVKIRGYRIELGEIEAVLNGCEGVKEAVVEAGTEGGAGGGEKRLMAYVATDEGAMLSSAVLKEQVEKRLPQYMVPSGYIILKELPRTGNGKLDRRKLPASGQQSAGEYQAPRTAVEEILAGIWQQVLKLDRVGIDQNFFELGGHSLLVTKVASRLREAFRVNISLRVLFENPTIRELAARLVQAKQQDCPSVLTVKKAGPRVTPVPLSFAQQRLWFLQQLQPEGSFYNMPFAVRLSGKLNTTFVRESINEIVRRHESLRTSFPSVDGQPEQKIEPPSPIFLPLIDLMAIPLGHQEKIGRHLTRNEANRPFDLENGPLFRATLVFFAEEDHLLLLTFHHTIADGWSMELFEREFTVLYDAFPQGRRVELPDLPLQYADFAICQREWLTDAALAEQLGYWLKQLANAPGKLHISDKVRPGPPSYQGAVVLFSVASEPAAQLKILCQRERVTMFMLTLAAFSTLLYRYSGQADIVVGSPIANRNHRGTENLIGLFVNQIALRCNLKGNPTFTELLKRIREMTLDAFVHQDFPFDKLVTALAPRRDLRQSPLFQVWFYFQQRDAVADHTPLASVSGRYVSSEFTMAKLDLALFMQTTSAGLAGQLIYATDLFEHGTIVTMAKHMACFLEAVAYNPDCHLLEAQLIPAGEGAALPGTDPDFYKKKTLETIS